MSTCAGASSSAAHGGARRARRRAGAAARPGHARRPRRRGGSARAPLPVAAQPADRHVRRADDGEPLVRPLPGLAARGRRAPGGPALHRRRRAHSSPPTAWRPTSRAAASSTPTTPGRAAAPSSTAGDGRLPARRRATCSRSATTPSRTCRSSRTRPRRSPPTTASSARCWPRRYPNREYMHAAQSYGMTDNTLPQQRPARLPRHDDLHTRFAAGRRRTATSTPTCRSRRCGARPVSRARARCRSTTSAAARARCRRSRSSTPSFNGEDQGTSGDEHPHGDVRTGQAFMADVVHAFMESPQ